MQMAGRVLRRHKDLPIKQIVQSKLTKYPFLRVAHARYQFLWENSTWKSLTINPELDDINDAARMAIATSVVVLPQFLRKAMEKRSRRRSDNGGNS
jgi:hypothetical protein